MNKIWILSVVGVLVLPMMGAASDNDSIFAKRLQVVMADLVCDQFRLHLPLKAVRGKEAEVKITKHFIQSLGQSVADCFVVWHMNYVPFHGLPRVPPGEGADYTLTFRQRLPNISAGGTEAHAPDVSKTKEIGTLSAEHEFTTVLAATKENANDPKVTYTASASGNSRSTEDGSVVTTQIDIPYCIFGLGLCAQNRELSIPGCATCPSPGSGNCPVNISFLTTNNASQIRYSVQDAQGNNIHPPKTCTANNMNANDCSSMTGDVGQTLQVHATPAAGYRFNNWTSAAAPAACHVQNAGVNCAIPIIDFGGYCDAVVLGSFVPSGGDTTQRTLTVTKTGSGSVSSTPTGINCGTDCIGTFDQGSSVTLTKAAAAGWHFVRWTGACTGTGICTVVMNAAKSVAALFEENSGGGGGDNTLTVTKAGAGNGRITSAPVGIDCPSGPCFYDFPSTQSVTLTPVAIGNSIFAGFSGDCSGTGPCTVSMASAQNVTATFNVAFTLGVARAGSVGNGTVSTTDGLINCPGDCSEPYAAGSPPVHVNANASGNTEFIGFSGACNGMGPCDVTMDAAKNVTATFRRRNLLTVTKGGTGSGNITSVPTGISCPGDCSEYFPNTAAVELTAHPDANNTFEWSGACSGTSLTCTIPMNQVRAATGTFTQGTQSSSATFRLAFEGQSDPPSENTEATNPRIGDGRIVFSWHVYPYGNYTCSIAIYHGGALMKTISSPSTDYIGNFQVDGYNPMQTGDWWANLTCYSTNGGPPPPSKTVFFRVGQACTHPEVPCW